MSKLRDASPNRPMRPEGLMILLDFINEEEESKLLESVYKEEWDTSMHRRVQHYGYKYDYKNRTAAKKIGELPKWSEPITKQLNEKFAFHPDQLIVNEYKQGQGISRHIDSRVFASPIVSVSLGSHCTMIFRKGTETYPLLLPRRCLVLMDGDARYKWTHEIPARTHDDLVPRKTRTSLTFRKVI